MFKRQKTGSVLCTSCGKLVGVQDESCWSCGRRNPGLWGFGPLLRKLGSDAGFVPGVIFGCSALYLAMLLVNPEQIQMGGIMSFLAPGTPTLFMFGASGAIPVFGFGRWWTLLSASWLHANLIHIIFNLMWVRQLAPATAELYGPARMVIIYTLSGVTGFLLSTLAGVFLGAFPIPFLRGAQFTVGASAPIFGLLGALVYFGRRGGSSSVGRQASGYAIIMFIMGLIMPGIDNYAHLGGFLGGYLTSRWLDPLRPERVDHMIAALFCFVCTAVSVLASLLHGFQLFR